MAHIQANNNDNWQNTKTGDTKLGLYANSGETPYGNFSQMAAVS